MALAAAQAAAVAARVAAAAAAGIQGIGGPGSQFGNVVNEEIKVPDKMVGLSKYKIFICLIFNYEIWRTMSVNPLQSYRPRRRTN